MRTKVLMTMITVLLTAVTVWGQQPAKSPAQPAPASKITALSTQWEYLVISFGKTYFSNPITSPELKTAGLSKLLAFSTAGLMDASEAVTTQKQLDVLGRYGWELVSVIGTIGGDQQLLFKRQYEPERSRKEAELIAEEGRALKQAQEEAAKKEAEVAASLASQQALVDLDAVDAYNTEQAIRQRVERRFTEALSSVTKYKIIDHNIRYYGNISTTVSRAISPISIEVTIDGTDVLLRGGNSYRKSEAIIMASQGTTAIASAMKIPNKGLIGAGISFTFRTKVVIYLDGKQIEVASDYNGADYAIEKIYL